MPRSRPGQGIEFVTQTSTPRANDKNVVDFSRANARNSDIPAAPAADQATNVGNPDIRDDAKRATEFLLALFGARPSARPHLVYAALGREVTTEAKLSRSAIEATLREAAGAPVSVLLATAGEVFFVYRHGRSAELEALEIAPTALLSKGDEGLALFALESPVLADDIADLLATVGCDREDAIPLPQTGGWTLVRCDPETYYDLTTLIEAFGVESAPAVPESAGATFLDARVLSPLDLDAAELQEEMVISVGATFQSKKWRNETMSRAQFVALLARHPVGKQKDGPGFVLGEIVGDNRRKQAVKACWGIGLDIDVGMPGHEIDAALAELGCLAIRYTTFSHGKTVSKFNRDKIIKWCAKNSREFDADSVHQYLSEEVRWDPRVLESAEYYGDVHEPEGVLACVRHAPMEKHRVIVPLAEPFIPSAVAPTHGEGMKRWSDACRGMAKRLGDLPMDHSAVDPSRLFYFPRHAEGKPHETTIHGGPLFDWRTLDLGAASDAGDEFDRALAEEVAGGRPTSKSKTPEGRELGRWSIKRAGGFQIVEVIRDYAEDRIRTPGATKIDLECPFDESHSNPGDPEDRGCFAVNAGDGSSPVFTVHCQHDSCQGKTNLDFVGKMLKDEWFPRDVLEDETYHAVLDDAEPSEAAPPSPRAKKSRRVRKAGGTLEGWQERLALAPKGQVLPTLSNLLLLIENDGRTKGVLGFNLFTGTVVRVGTPGLKKQDGALQLNADCWLVRDPVNGDLWTDAHDQMLRAALEAPEEEGGYDIRITDRDLRAAVSLVARANPFHPVRDYLQSLKWDGTKRVTNLFVKYLGTDNDAYHREIARLFMLGAVTRAFEPGTKIDESVILEGVQGKRKSTFVETLAVDQGWYCDLAANFDDPKACVELMLGKWIIELGELSGMARSDVRAAKAFLARHTDKVRLAYAHHAQEFPRGCVFMGSTNDKGYLKDPTGGRRFWPVECKIATAIDIEGLRGEIDQLWAEAYEMYVALRQKHQVGKLPLYLAEKKAVEIAQKLQASRTIDSTDDALAGRIEEWLDASHVERVDGRDVSYDRRERVCLPEVWEDCLGRDPKDYAGHWPVTLGQVLRNIEGWESTGERGRFGEHGRQRIFQRVKQSGA